MQVTDFHYTTADWRQELRKNEQKTRVVIVSFIIVYLLVGLLVDVVIANNMYRAPLQKIVVALLTFQLIPYATIIMGIIALISLWITYTFYDRLMLLGTEYHEITSETGNLEEKQLYNVVEEMKVAAGLQYMPRVFIIEANYMNAFASGYSEKSAMVAITRGLMQKLNRSELQAVMAHELSHIKHHDIKLTLMVAVLSNLMLIVIDLLFYNMIFSRNRDREDNRLAIVIVVLRYVLPLLTVLLTLYLSRTREFMADAGCVELTRDNEPLARALLKINQDSLQNIDEYSQEYGQTPHEDVRRASYIFDPVSSEIEPIKSLASAFSTHPTLEQRLDALGYKPKS